MGVGGKVKEITDGAVIILLVKQGGTLRFDTALITAQG